MVWVAEFVLRAAVTFGLAMKSALQLRPLGSRFRGSMSRIRSYVLPDKTWSLYMYYNKETGRKNTACGLKREGDPGMR
jgi:hypothetical protein